MKKLKLNTKTISILSDSKIDEIKGGKRAIGSVCAGATNKFACINTYGGCDAPQSELPTKCMGTVCVCN